jgi:hypothetical protein
VEKRKIVCVANAVSPARELAIFELDKDPSDRDRVIRIIRVVVALAALPLVVIAALVHFASINATQ